jgi:hypothetical protein
MRAIYNKNKDKTNIHPWILLMNEEFKDKTPKIFTYFSGFRTILFVNDCQLMEDILSTR